jgi:hypothetical protein
MRIGRRNRTWAIASVALLLAAALAHLVDRPMTAGSGVALGNGIAAGSTMIFAALLGLRKKLLRVRLGPVAAWTSAHNWLGAMAIGFALLHTGFTTGGPLTTVLMGCLAISAASGIFGAAIQLLLPSIMTSRLPDESAREDLGAMFQEYRARADELVTKAGIGVLTRFHQETIVPFLTAPRSPDAVLASEVGATLAFEARRGQRDREQLELVEQLREICIEARLRADEMRLKRWLRTWELVHIPVSMIALVSLIAHAIAAVYY